MVKLKLKTLKQTLRVSTAGTHIIAAMALTWYHKRCDKTLHRNFSREIIFNIKVDSRF